MLLRGCAANAARHVTPWLFVKRTYWMLMSSLRSSLKVICLLDVFTPDSTLEKFQTLWVSSQRPHSSAGSRSLSRPRVRVCACMKCTSKDVWEQAFSWLSWLVCAAGFSHHSNELPSSVYLLSFCPLPICWSIRCFFLTVCLPHPSSSSCSSSLFSYIVMPFVAQDLGHIMKRRRLTDRIITYLFYQLLRGLKVSFFLIIWTLTHTRTVNTHIHYKTNVWYTE